MRRNVSPKRMRPYSQSHRKTSPTKHPQYFKSSSTDPIKKDYTIADNCETWPLDALMAGNLEHKSAPREKVLQGVGKKFNEENKSSQQLLMLQQQLYQEEQLPGNASTQFFSHFAKYQQTSYYGYDNQWQPNGYYDGSEQYGCISADDTSYQHPNPPFHYQNSNGPARGFQPIRNSDSNGHTQGEFQPIRNAGTNGHINGFQPTVRSASSIGNSSNSSSPSDFNSEEFPAATDLIISNLDYNISPREWKNILTTTFHPHVKMLYIDVCLQPDNTSLGFMKVASIDEARFAISQFHRKKIGYKRIHVTLKMDDGTKAVSTIRSEAITLLSEARDNVLPLFKFIELCHKRFNRSVSVAELYKMKDTIEIREQSMSGRMIHLAPGLRNSDGPHNLEDAEVSEFINKVVCSYHCPVGSSMYTEAISTSILPNVKVHLKTFAPQVHSLLMTHDGHIPLMSFPACFSVEVTPLMYVYDGGIPVEHLISCVPGVQIVTSNTGIKTVSWAENRMQQSPDLRHGGCNSNMLNQFCMDMVELLSCSANCRQAFSRFIPTYHQHFGRQCRVADYGFSRLQDLFEAVSHVVQVLGMGDRKVLTLTHRAQVRRFTNDLVWLLKNISAKQLFLSTLTEEFCKLFKRNWNILEYGVCHIDDMLAELPAGTFNIVAEGNDLVIDLSRKGKENSVIMRNAKKGKAKPGLTLSIWMQYRSCHWKDRNQHASCINYESIAMYQTADEAERMKQFTLELIELLKHSQRCRMSFNKFIPAYHQHFGNQCRVSDYGFFKLQDLFEALPHIVTLEDDGEGKVICLTEPELRKFVGEQIVSLLKHKKVNCFPMDKLMNLFTEHYGYVLQLQDFNVQTIEELMWKLKHAVKVEVYDGKLYLVLADRTSAPPLARQVLQLLMDQSGGSLPLMELCSRYKTTFGIDPDIKKIQEELLEYVQISGDDESGVISLTPLQALARDIRLLLQQHGKMSLSHFERIFYEKFCLEFKPSLYGFPTSVALLMAIPHVVSIKGKGNRRMVHLSGDLQGSLPIIDESYTRQESEMPSNDSGSALTDEDTSIEQMKYSPINHNDNVSSGVSSPTEIPNYASHIDLTKFKSHPVCRRSIFSLLSDEEKQQEQSPFSQTPTSQLLQSAAQFLPSSQHLLPPIQEFEKPLLEKSHQPSSTQLAEQQFHDILQNCVLFEPVENESQDLFNIFKRGWWSASPSQLQEVSDSIKRAGMVNMAYTENTEDFSKIASDLKHNNFIQDNIFTSESNGIKITETVGKLKPAEKTIDSDLKIRKEDTEFAVQNLMATISYLQQQNEIEEIKRLKEKRENDLNDQLFCEDKQQWRAESKINTNSIGQSALRSHLFSKQFQNIIASDAEVPDPSKKDVTIALLPTVKTNVQECPKTIFQPENIYYQENVGEVVASVPVGMENSKTLSDDTIPELAANLIDIVSNSSVAQELIMAEKLNMDVKTSKSGNFVHQIENCVAEDCMCYKVIFQQDHPMGTSSLKSDSSFTDSIENSPKKVLIHLKRLNTSSLSDESNKRKSRIAAKFEKPLD